MFRIAALLLLLVAPAWAGFPGVVDYSTQEGLTGTPATLVSRDTGAPELGTYRVSITTSAAIYDSPGNLCIAIYPYNRWGEGDTAGVSVYNLPLSGIQSVTKTLHLDEAVVWIFSWPQHPGCQPNSFPNPYDYSVVVERLA